MSKHLALAFFGVCLFILVIATTVMLVLLLVDEPEAGCFSMADAHALCILYCAFIYTHKWFCFLIQLPDESGSGLDSELSVSLALCSLYNLFST